MATACNPFLFFNMYYTGAISSVVTMKTHQNDEHNKNHIHSNIDYVPLLLLTWAVATLISWTAQSFSNGQVRRLLNRRENNSYNYQIFDNQSIRGDGKVNSVNVQQRTFSYPDALEFNYFDPDNLPDTIIPYAGIVFSTVQLLAKQYGFQVDNSRNQAEHLLMMLTNEVTPTDSDLSLAPARIHFQLFSNYRKWCNRMNTVPLFSTRLHEIEYASNIEDSLVFLLIWGESANLKHLPECLCFLYHKIMQENAFNIAQNISPTTYPGYYLDMVVIPIYDVVASSLKESGDNEYKKTYDDFNEFFWSPTCLQFKIHDNVEDIGVEGRNNHNNNDNDNNNDGNNNDNDDSNNGSINKERISVGMKNATKTYLEKRSWLHPLLSVHRVIEWHTITFTLLMAWAFSNKLVWTYAFTFQIASFIFLEITFLGLIWTCLEVNISFHFISFHFLSTEDLRNTEIIP